jgi:DNA primase
LAVYHAKLQHSPEVLTDLLARGVDLEAVIHFELGYCEVGRFAGRVTVPVLNERGRAVQMAGWKLRREKHKWHDEAPGVLYLPTRMEGVFNVSGLRGAKEIVLCESVIDALVLWCSGTRAVTSTFGVTGLTDEMLMAYRRLGVESVQVSFESDEYGRTGCALVSRRLEAAGFKCSPCA